MTVSTFCFDVAWQYKSLCHWFDPHKLRRRHTVLPCWYLIDTQPVITYKQLEILSFKTAEINGFKTPHEIKIVRLTKSRYFYIFTLIAPFCLILTVSLFVQIYIYIYIDIFFQNLKWCSVEYIPRPCSLTSFHKLKMVCSVEHIPGPPLFFKI